MLNGFQSLYNEANRQGTTSKSWFGFGGGESAERDRSMLLVLVTRYSHHEVNMSTSEIIPVTLPEDVRDAPDVASPSLPGLSGKIFPRTVHRQTHPPGRGQYVKLRAGSGGTHVRGGFTGHRVACIHWPCWPSRP
ncbi:Uncharacterised protein [Escherichia coli]|nr:Uncharacterised protein [Escherichia coli]